MSHESAVGGASRRPLPGGAPQLEDREPAVLGGAALARELMDRVVTRVLSDGEPLSPNEAKLVAQLDLERFELDIEVELREEVLAATEGSCRAG